MQQNITMRKIVRQHNDYVAAPYAVELTSHEIKLIEFMISDSKDLDKQLILDNQNKQFEFTATELAKILSTSLSRIVADADKLANSITMKRIIEKQLDINGNVEEFVYIPIITFAKYHKGLFKFAFNSYVLKYFVDINRNFTEFQLNYLLSMTTSYSIKLYKLLYQYKNIKHRVFSVLDLKEQFGISGKYAQYGDFKKYVLVPSVSQINKLTDLSVNYNEIKIGRSVIKLNFTFEVKKAQIPTDKSFEVISVNDASSDVSNVINQIESELSTQTKSIISQFIQDKGIEYVDASINYAKKHAKTNLDKYLCDTLKNCWAEVEIKKNTDKKTRSRAKSVSLEQEQNKKLVAKEQDKLNKSLIEHEWNKLLDKDKSNYINYSQFIINKHKNKLKAIKNLEDTLPLCIYAVSNDKSYDLKVEAYVANMAYVSLDINNTLV